MTFVGVALKYSSELAALILYGLTRITLLEGETVYSGFKYRNKMSYAVDPIVNYTTLFEVSTKKDGIQLLDLSSAKETTIGLSF